MYIFRKISGKRKKSHQSDRAGINSTEDAMTSDDSSNNIGSDDSTAAKLVADHPGGDGNSSSNHFSLNHRQPISSIGSLDHSLNIVDDDSDMHQGNSSCASNQDHHRNDTTRSKELQSALANRQSQDNDGLDKLHQMRDFHCEKIGSGFFANVYKVKHRASGQVMVLKMSKSPADRKTMQQEIKTMYNLEHPNILRLMGLCVHDGKFHVLMEFINGGTLERLLFDSSMDLWWSVRLLLGHNIASGMAYLHSKGIIHRDLTSKNCLIKREKGRLTAVVADFGLAAKIPNSIHECDKTMSIVGSPYWMAPEVLGGRKYDEKADIFSYGIVLCEILARISADPDELPRTHNFGLDAESFQPLIDTGYPDEFFQLAIHCCQLDPKRRRKFLEIKEIIADIRAKVAATEGHLPIAALDNQFINDVPKSRQTTTLSSNQREEKAGGFTSSHFAALRLKHISADLRLSTIEKFSALTTSHLRSERDPSIRESSVNEDKAPDELEQDKQSDNQNGFSEPEVFEETDQTLASDSDVNTMSDNALFDPFMNSKFSYALSNLRRSSTSSPKVTDSTKYYSSMPNLNVVPKAIRHADDDVEIERDNVTKMSELNITKMEADNIANVHEPIIQIQAVDTVEVIDTTTGDEKENELQQISPSSSTVHGLEVNVNKVQDLCPGYSGVTRSASHCSPKISPFKSPRSRRF